MTKLQCAIQLVVNLNNHSPNFYFSLGGSILQEIKKPNDVDIIVNPAIFPSLKYVYLKKYLVDMGFTPESNTYNAGAHNINEYFRHPYFNIPVHIVFYP